MLHSLLDALLNASEKAANIARLTRKNDHLLNLLVQEKSSAEANPRFVQDFKTLADVLIQETIRHDVGLLFPELLNNIKGEESSTFTNILGETVDVQVLENEHLTAERLCKVLNNDCDASNVLAHEVHVEINLNNELPQFEGVEIDLSKLGIWIDPIDATSEYIRGVDSSSESFPKNGLSCVTVLIGVYDTVNGNPILGVINQPFYKKVNEEFKGKIYWGVSYNGIHKTSEEFLATNEKLAVLSMAENSIYMNMFEKMGFNCTYASGAGYKILTVINGMSSIYFVSGCTTFKWDTCGGQAILKAFGGNLYSFRESIAAHELVPINYHRSSGKCNSNGLIGCRNDEIAKQVIEELAKNV